MIGSTFAATAPTLGGQVVQGTLLESGSERPVVLGELALLDTALAVVDWTVSDQAGRFVLRAPAPGAYLVSAERVGYSAIVDGIVELGEDGFLPVRIYLRPQPVELEGVTATVRRERIVSKLEGAGFYERMNGGFGHFISPEDIRQRPPADVPDLLRRVPGPVFRQQGANGYVAYFRARGPGTANDGSVPAGYCRPRVYVDGIEMPQGVRHAGRGDNSTAAEIAIREVVPIHDVVAVEVYSGGATLPLQWGGSQGNCGVLLFWTEG